MISVRLVEILAALVSHFLILKKLESKSLLELEKECGSIVSQMDHLKKFSAIVKVLEEKLSPEALNSDE
jgi:hypothetical protein